MIDSRNQKRVLALDVRPRSYGYVVFEGPERLLDWGVRSFRHGVNDVRVPRVKKLAALLEEFEPSVVMLRSVSSRSAKKPGKRMRISETFAEQARKRGIAVREIGSRAIRKALGSADRLTKYQVACAVAERFPELAPRLPPKRKPWQSEDYRMSIFDAAALGVAYFARRAKRVPNTSRENTAPSQPT